MKGYDKQCDVWSMGVIVYILLCGFPPFYADNDAQLFERIKAGKYEFLKPYWDPISDAAKDFVRKMLQVDPKKRATVGELMSDPWLKDEKPLTKSMSTVSELKKHLAVARLKAAANATIAANRLSHAIEG